MFIGFGVGFLGVALTFLFFRIIGLTFSGWIGCAVLGYRFNWTYYLIFGILGSILSGIIRVVLYTIGLDFLVEFFITSIIIDIGSVSAIVYLLKSSRY